MTTLERWLLATVIALLVGLWHAAAARTPDPKVGLDAGGTPVRSPRSRPRVRRNTRRVTPTRRTA